jgi:hypothetical protein
VRLGIFQIPEVPRCPPARRFACRSNHLKR